MPETPYPLGRVEHHDPRSRQFAAPQLPELRSISHTPPPLLRRLNQIGSSCEGNALAHGLGTKPYHRPFTKYLDEPKALEIYTRATELDQFPGNMPTVDEGTSNLGAAKAAQWLGLITSYQWAFGLTQALGALMVKPLHVGLPWDEAMFDVDDDGFIGQGGQQVGGHAFEIYGINLRGGYLWMLNSWAGWGFGQRAKIRIGHFDKLLKRGGEVTTFTV